MAKARTRPTLPDQDTFKLNEVCKVADVQPYMLRFWGTEFPQLEASKSGTGQRIYSRDQVLLILEIRRLLFDEGLTIAAAKKRIAADGPPPEAQAEAADADAAGEEAAPAPAAAGEVDKKAAERVERLEAALKDVRDELEAVADELKRG